MKRSALKITPFDTLFFRGTLPMEAGKSCSMSLFPPTPDTVTGALRTALLAANGIGIDDFKRGKTIPEVGTYGHADQQFKVVGIGVENDSVLYAKAPVALFPLEGGKVELAMQVSPSETGLGISSSSPTVFIAPPDREANAKGLASAWCDIRMFSDKSLRTTEHIVMPEAVSSQLFSYEVRTGIAIDPKTGMAQEHMLYSAGHVRMAQGAALVVIVDCDLPLPESGTIRLGG